MIALEVFMDILALHRQGLSMRAIARKMGIHRKTVKKYLMDLQPPNYSKSNRKENLGP